MASSPLPGRATKRRAQRAEPAQMASTVVAEQIDPTYEPTQSEMEEYAMWLGMEVWVNGRDTHARQQDRERGKHHHLLWIAREALKAPLPPHWKLCQTPGGEVFYFNFQNAASSWEHPSDQSYKHKFATFAVAANMDQVRRVQLRQAADNECPAKQAELEAVLRHALSLDLTTEASIEIVNRNVAAGLLDRGYYIRWWHARVNVRAEKIVAQYEVPSPRKLETALSRLNEEQRFKMQMFMDRSPREVVVPPEMESDSDSERENGPLSPPFSDDEVDVCGKAPVQESVIGKLSEWSSWGGATLRGSFEGISKRLSGAVFQPESVFSPRRAQTSVLPL